MLKRIIDWFKPKKVKPLSEYLYSGKVHVMLDIETMGKNPKAPVTSIGAVVFNPSTGELKEEFSCKVDLIDSAKYGKIDAETILWWLKRAKENTPEFLEGDILSLHEALLCLDGFLKQLGKKKNVLVWGNGCDFDNVILQSAYCTLGLDVPWEHWNNQSVRTAVLIGREILGIDPKYTLKFEGEAHKALDDAKHQAHYVSIIWEQLETILTLVKLKDWVSPEEMCRINKLVNDFSTHDITIKASVVRTSVKSDLDSLCKRKIKRVIIKYIKDGAIIYGNGYGPSETELINSATIGLTLCTLETREEFAIADPISIETQKNDKPLLSTDNLTPSVLKVKQSIRIPGGRYIDNNCKDGWISGEEFRDLFLIPNLEIFGETIVDLDGTLGYGSDWLEEVFGGLVREFVYGGIPLMSNLDITARKELALFVMENIKSDDDITLKEEIKEYMLKAIKGENK